MNNQKSLSVLVQGAINQLDYKGLLALIRISVDEPEIKEKLDEAIAISPGIEIRQILAEHGYDDIMAEILGSLGHFENHSYFTSVSQITQLKQAITACFVDND